MINTPKIFLLLLVHSIIFLLVPGTMRASDGGPTSCLTCHANPDYFEDESRLEIVRNFGKGFHAEIGISCHNCHGGNPSPDLVDDLSASMDSDFKKNPFIGAPERKDIPAFCGRCHSDPAYMKEFRQDVRVDQELKYATSHHGKALEKGNGHAATCIDCHGVHGIRRIDDPQSPVYPTRVSKTCGSCHSNPDIMDSAILRNHPLPVGQAELWRRSVHGQALMDKGDLFSPTCNDCHGNHGAAPSGLDSLTFVCGQCHGRETKLFLASPKHQGFGRHNELYLEEAGQEGCGACHDASGPQARIKNIRRFNACIVCHGNHAIIRPTIAMLTPLPSAPCNFCHEGSATLEAAVPEPVEKRARFKTQRDLLISKGKALQLEGDDLFDWLVDRALGLPFHTRIVAEDGEEKFVLRPEFARLFEKFRIGKIHPNFPGISGKEKIKVRVTRCSHCHPPESPLGGTSKGLETAGTFLGRMHELTVMIARAERILLSARQGGVETGRAIENLDQAVNAQIELEVLVHTFSTEEGSPFIKRHAEGIQYARKALEAGQEALKELKTRHRGLFFSLVFIVLVLIGLALKIRQISREEIREEK